MAKLVTNPRRIQQVLSYLPATEAFGAAKVSQAFQTAQASLDARFYLSMRPDAWLHGNDLDPEFNRRLLRDWHLCLRDSALQVAYVDHRQHLIYVESSCSLAAPPQGQDVFPVRVDHQDYRCSIEPFHLDCLWWDCLQGELFDWPRVSEEEADAADDAADALDSPPAPQQVSDLAGYPPKEVPVESPFELEAVPGYNGSLAAPKLPDDVLVVLSLNAAWFNSSLWTRKLQGIFLLRDGRFLLVGSCEMQGTIESQARARVYRGFVANSLLALVTFAQDPRSREILRTRLPLGEDIGKGVQPTVLAVNIPRVQHDNAEDFKKRFGPFLRASRSCDKVLFSTLEVDQEEGRKHLKAGDRVRVLRRGDNFIWSSCRCPGWAAPQGAVSPQLDAEYLERASQEDLRFTTAGGCHLGLLRDRWYDAEVVHVNADRTLDVKYTNPREWSNGASGFAAGQGNDRNEAPIEADVEIGRAKVIPKSRWYSAFQDVWEGCGGLSDVGLSFAGGGSRSVRCLANNTSAEDEKEGDLNLFLKLADVFADTAAAHRFRFMTLLEEKDTFAGQDRQSIEEIHSTAEPGGYPREAHVTLGKRLFLQLLRSSFWEKWTAQRGESPSKIANVFKTDKFVRLVIQ